MLRLWITTDKNLSPIHPGEILFEDFMKPLGLTQYRLARDLRVTPIQVRYDLEVAEQELGKRINREVKVR